MSEQARNKTAMVLMALERSLGDYIRKNASSVTVLPKSITRQIEVRQSTTVHADATKLEIIIQSAYLDELLALAEASANAEVHIEAIRSLKRLYGALQIPKVRNAFAHPNRLFPEAYWYRAATIASDPLAETLGFSDLQKALQQAEQGTLLDVPDDWIRAAVWTIPNNLPERAEHDITGLIGRQKEQKDLKKRLFNPRLPLLAVQAPGGLGKTALALEVLRNVVVDLEASEVFSAVLYFSAKTEELTPEGIRNISAALSVQDLVDRIADAYLEAIGELGGTSATPSLPGVDERSKVCLCIDNAEGLLRDEPGVLDAFLTSLPAAWTVLVTSRVLVNGASTMVLEPLDRDGARQLARIYGRSIGVEAISNLVVDTVVDGCLSNPLAIRLAIAAYGRGRVLDDAVSTSASNVAEFAYQNLVDSLSHNTLLTLEVILLSDGADQRTLLETLELGPDEISECLSALMRAGLVARRVEDHEETYELGPGVKQLVLTNGRNIAVRAEINDRVGRIQAKAQEADFDQAYRRISTEHWAFLSQDVPDALRGMLGAMRPTLLKRDRDVANVVHVKQQIDALRDAYDEEPSWWAYGGRVAELLGDFGGAEEFIGRAIELSDESYRYRAQLATLLIERKEFGRAVEACDQLLLTVAEEGVSHEAHKRLVVGRYLALLFGGEFETILVDTEKWADEEMLGGVLGSFRAWALKRISERARVHDKLELLSEAVRLLRQVTKRGDGDRTLREAGTNVISEIAYSIEEFEDVAKAVDLLNFVHEHGADIYSDKPRDYVRLTMRLSRLQVEGNPFRQIGGDEFETVAEGDWIEVVVYHVPNPNRGASFLFAEDAWKNQYFLHQDAYVGSARWKDLCKVGARAQIVVDEGQVTPGKSPRASTIRVAGD